MFNNLGQDSVSLDRYCTLHPESLGCLPVPQFFLFQSWLRASEDLVVGGWFSAEGDLEFDCFNFDFFFFRKIILKEVKS